MTSAREHRKSTQIDAMPWAGAVKHLLKDSAKRWHFYHLALNKCYFLFRVVKMNNAICYWNARKRNFFLVSTSLSQSTKLCCFYWSLAFTKIICRWWKLLLFVVLCLIKMLSSLNRAARASQSSYRQSAAYVTSLKSNTENLLFNATVVRKISTMTKYVHGVVLVDLSRISLSVWPSIDSESVNQNSNNYD